MHSTLERLLRNFATLFSNITAFVAKRKSVLSGCVMTLMLLVVTYLGYMEFARTDITVLAGPEGGAGSIYADSIVAAARGSMQLENISIEAQRTRGFEDNRAQIAKDKSGTLIGFANDGFGDSANVRILLPLEEDYLHVVCSRRFYQHLLTCIDCGDPQNPSRSGSVVARSRSGTATAGNDVEFLAAPSADDRKTGQVNGEDKELTSDDSAGNPEEKVTPIQSGTPSSETILSTDVRAIAQAIEKINEPVLACAKQTLPRLYHILYLCRNYSRTSTEGGTPVRKDNDPAHGLPTFVLGPDGSGARHLALEVLRHFRFEPDDDYQELQVNDWADLRNNLKRNMVDLAFFLGPLDSPVINQIARDNTAFLVGLGEDASALSADLTHPTRIHDMVRYQYGRNIEAPSHESDLLTPVTNFGGNNISLRSTPEFCEPIAVLTTRRVLICSELMSTSVAYRVVTFARDAISGQIPSFRWSANTSNGPGPERLSFPLHPAAKLLRDDESPSWISRMVPWLWPTVILPIFLLLIQSAAAWGARLTSDDSESIEQTDRSPPKGDTLSHAELDEKLGKLGEVLDNRPESADMGWHRNWQKELEQFSAYVADADVEEDVRKHYRENAECLLLRYKEMEFFDSRTSLKQLVETVERLEMEKTLNGKLSPTKKREWDKRIGRLESLISAFTADGRVSESAGARLHSRIDAMKSGDGNDD